MIKPKIGGYIFIDTGIVESRDHQAIDGPGSMIHAAFVFLVPGNP